MSKITIGVIQDFLKETFSNVFRVDPSKSPTQDNAYIAITHRPDGYFLAHFPYPGTMFYTGLGGFIHQCELGIIHPIVYNGQLIGDEDRIRFFEWCKDLKKERLTKTEQK